jgi:Coenzyme PQQ synthesis protein D (PqqD)
VTLSADVLSAGFGEGENILLDVTSGTYFSLEGTGAFLWDMWRDDGSVEHSIERLVAAYAVDRAIAEGDVMALIDDLLVRGLISVSDGKPDSAAT